MKNNLVFVLSVLIRTYSMLQKTITRLCQLEVEGPISNLEALIGDRTTCDRSDDSGFELGENWESGVLAVPP